jgi:integrase
MLIARYSKLAGLQPITPKMLRHSFIMNSKLMGITANEILYQIGSAKLGAVKLYFE